jgi:subtilisin family serine protease
LRDFADGKSTTRVIINMSKPVTFDRSGSFKSDESRKNFRETVNTVQNRVISRMDSSRLRITNRFSYNFGISAEVTAKGLQELLEMDEVFLIEKDEMLKSHLAQGIPLMGASSVRHTYDGSGVAIAICDTGIDYSHSMLGGGGFPNNKVIGGRDTGDNDNDPMDLHGHGTCCAGIAAGNTGATGDYIGGVAPNAKLYALKVTLGSSDLSYYSDMIEAWEWCITHQNDDPYNPIMVVSTSLGSGQYVSVCDGVYSAMTDAVANLTSAGISLFVSSGNDGYCDAISFPACISDVISVGAVYDAALGTYFPCIQPESCVTTYGTGSCGTGYYAIDSTAADAVPSYSNTAVFLDLLAPSNRAYTTDIAGRDGYSNGDYDNSFGGTSAACPYAAGAAACLQSAAKIVTGTFLTPSKMRAKLTETGDAITDLKVAITTPRVNLAAAVNALPELVVNRIVLKDLDEEIVTKDFSPGTNIKYKVKFTVNGSPDKLYKVVVTGKAVSLYKPHGVDPEWKDTFDGSKVRKLNNGETKKVFWNSQIPGNATSGYKAKAKFKLKLKEYDEVTATWNLLDIYYANKKFNIVP